MLFVLCLGVFSQLFAANVHTYPKMDNAKDKAGATHPGYCAIELINDTYTDVRVFGTFDDGSSIDFLMFRDDIPHYISLYYNFYCHRGMHIAISSPYGVIYSDWTNVNTTIHLVPYLNKIKAEVSAR
jgi:hypothetical protein